MKNFIQDFLINLASEIVAALIFALIGIIIYISLYWKNRRGILRFFGIGNSRPSICVYMSRLTIKSGGTEAIEYVERGYSGAAITKLEYDGALLIQNELKSRLLALLPTKVQDWLGEESIELKTIDVPIKLSSLRPIDDGVFRDNLILIGTGIYNSLSHHYLNDYFKKYSQRYSCYFFHEKDDKGQRVIGINRKGIKNAPIEGRDKGNEPGFILRIIDVDYKISVFICGGLGSSATYGSARYLAKNWKSLQKEFQNKEFGIALIFPNQEPDGEFVQKPIVCDKFLLR
ncbi:MAG: hypothetical protein HC862_01705 [Scytonema sp. RU_4_4]|nr:hypothetical protein [Scytonema sp. RU_4_4]NJR74981.1 hypothetical protein [Scytonema sp. CRU_2_7]